MNTRIISIMARATSKILNLTEHGCVGDQPQRVENGDGLLWCGRAAAGRDDTAALRVKMRIAGAIFCCLILAATARAADDWQTLFNGKDLTGWRANYYSNSWSVVDGTIRARATKASSHLFFVGWPTFVFIGSQGFEL